MARKRLFDCDRWLVPLGIAAAMLVLPGSPVAAAPPAAPAVAPVARLKPQRCPVSVEGVALTCGVLIVPENRARPESRRVVELNYVVVPSRAPTPQPDPVVFLTGGPGTSALAFLRNLAASPLRRDRAIIAIEQRGNGYGKPALLCTPDRDDSYRGCHARLLREGVDLAGFDTTQSAHDLADLKRLLAIDSWNVFGVSFGTFWALRYAALHPDGIRALILDSPYPLQASPRDGWIDHLNGLSAVFAACRDDTRCNAAYPDLRARFVALFEGLQASPVVIDKERFDGDLLFTLVTGVNFESGAVADLPAMIAAAERRDIAAFGAIVGKDHYRLPTGFQARRATAAGLNVNINCRDDLPFDGAETVHSQLAEGWPDAILTSAKRYDGFDRNGACAYWTVAPAEPVLNQPVTSSIPALIIVGALDPETPPHLASVMARTLPNATVAVVPGAAHAVSSVANPCPDAIAAAFVTAPAARPDLACLAALPAAPFTLPGDR